MRLSHSFGKTLRDAPADAELTSHQLLIRGNFVRPLGAGIYTLMPLGYRVLRKLWAIMVEEMDAIGGQEMWMPNLHLAAIWQATGRWDSYVPPLTRVKLGGREYVLSPTHEEVITDLALREVESYRDLPQMLYHIGKKFRDEPRPRGGLIRLREFVMKDAYSLSADEAALDAYFPDVLQAYANIYRRCGVDTAIPIHADVGAMGGKSSIEFTVPHPQGEDTYIACTNCDYAANVEAAEFIREGERPSTPDPVVKVATPGCETIADVAAYVGVPTSQTLKAVFYWLTPPGMAEQDGRLLFAVVRGDLAINEVKLSNAAGGGSLRPATEEEIEAVGAVPGYASPAALDVAADGHARGVVVIADPSIEAGGNFTAGANEAGYHFTGVNYPRDFRVTLLADIAQADTGHQCPRCNGRIEARRAIEVGHCFKLGTRYSVPTNATYLDENNDPQLIHMGSYGIGLDRLMAVIVELHHDEHGIIWPAAVAPYDVHLMHIGRDDAPRDVAEALYEQLRQAGQAVLYDDREASPGVKFNDADLIGIPWQVSVGARSLAQGGVELKRRATGERQLVPRDQLLSRLQVA